MLFPCNSLLSLELVPPHVSSFPQQVSHGPGISSMLGCPGNPGFIFTTLPNVLSGPAGRDTLASCLASVTFLSSREKIYNPIHTLVSLGLHAGRTLKYSLHLWLFIDTERFTYLILNPEPYGWSGAAWCSWKMVPFSYNIFITFLFFFFFFTQWNIYCSPNSYRYHSKVCVTIKIPWRAHKSYLS